MAPLFLFITGLRLRVRSFFLPTVESHFFGQISVTWSLRPIMFYLRSTKHHARFVSYDSYSRTCRFSAAYLTLSKCETILINYTSFCVVPVFD